MPNTLLIYPSIFMVLLTVFLYAKNYLDNIKATRNKSIKFSHFKIYDQEVPEHVAVSRQTLKNQFELPILFYFLISLIVAFDAMALLDIIFAWIFVISRYIHCYIRLTSNYVPSRAKIFQVGLITLIIWWISFSLNILR
tara:strand:- start:477 stop:893 length:417 start_codon:yes stop_codon:yes gene_type:complete